MKAQKRVVAIHDISGFGKCSLTVALPILSAAGVNTAVVPTALLSTHTGEFTGYTHLDLTDQLLPIATHLATLGLHFDAFYTGYLASPRQVDSLPQQPIWQPGEASSQTRWRRCSRRTPSKRCASRWCSPTRAGRWPGVWA